MALEEKQIKKLRKSFPDEAIQSVKKYKNTETGEWVELLGYKPPYVIERLNDVFGHENWNFRVLEHGIAEVDKKTSAWVLGELAVYIEKNETTGRQVLKQQFGHCTMNKFLPTGDALKGASTNSLEKAASLFDIGHEAYKGQLKKPAVELTPEEEKAELLAELKELCNEHDIDAKTFPTLTNSVLDKKIEAKDVKKSLKIEDIRKLIDHVKSTGSPF